MHVFHIPAEILRLKIKKPQFDAETIALLKSWEKQSRAKSAANEARYLERNSLIEKKAALQSRHAFLLRDKEMEAGWSADNEAQLADARQDYEEAVRELKAFDNEKAAPVSNRPRAQFRGHEIPFVESTEDWFDSLRTNHFFRHVTVELPEGEEIPALHERLISDAESVMHKLADTESAPLPVTDALAKWRSEVEWLAKQGCPRLTTLFRAKSSDGKRWTQGEMSWPEFTILHRSDPDNFSDGIGVAVLAAVFEKELLAFGEAIIKAKAKAFSLPAVPMYERAELIAKLQAELLAIHRLIVVAEDEMERRKISFEPFPYPLSPLAVLRVAPDPSRKLPKPDRSLIQTHADTRAVPSRS